MIFPYVFCGCVLIYGIFWSVPSEYRWPFFRCSTIILTIIACCAYLSEKIEGHANKIDKRYKMFTDLLKEGKK